MSTDICLVGIDPVTNVVEILASLKNQEHLSDHLKTITDDNCLPFVVNTEKAKKAWGKQINNYKELI